MTSPWLYTDEDLVLSTRSAIRHLRAIKLTLLFDMDNSGAFDTDPTETEGMLLALKVASDLLKGDLARKLNSGELGVSVKSVLDTFSTTEASRGFQKSASAYDMDFRTLLSIVFTDATDTASGVFGQQGLSNAGA